jgi:MFS family permease
MGERGIAFKKKRALVLSKIDGSFSSLMSSISNSFIIPFALALGASNFFIGMLSSFKGLAGPIAQLSSLHLMEKSSRKKIVLFMILLQALMIIPLILLGIMFWFNVWKDYLPALLILFYSLHIGFGAVAGPIWFSWMGDLVPEKRRGRYFSKRSRVIGFVAIVSVLLAGFLLDFFKTKGLVLIGFSVLFSIAMVARMVSLSVLARQYHPKFKLEKGYYFSFRNFLSHSYKNNFGRFALFFGLMYFAVNIASPFFAVYMLEELEFSYILFTVITLSAGVFSLLFIPFWGKFSDRYGNHLVLKICSLFIPLYPFLWLVSGHPLYLILVPSLVGGIFWGGFNLAAFNFIYDSVEPQHRALCSSYVNVLMGIGLFFGGLVGGGIAKFVSWEFMGSIFFTVFLVSGIVRVLVVFNLMPYIKEIREMKRPEFLIREARYVENLGHEFYDFRDSVFQETGVPKVHYQDLEKLERKFVGRVG